MKCHQCEAEIGDGEDMCRQCGWRVLRDVRCSCAGNRVEWDNGSLEFAIPPGAAIKLGEKLVVIHDYRIYPNNGPARNLVAYSLSGRELWVAEHPSRSEVDAYVDFVSGVPLRAWNYAGYLCTLDPETGRIIACESER